MIRRPTQIWKFSGPCPGPVWGLTANLVPSVTFRYNRKAKKKLKLLWGRGWAYSYTKTPSCPIPRFARTYFWAPNHFFTYTPLTQKNKFQIKQKQIGVKFSTLRVVTFIWRSFARYGMSLKNKRAKNVLWTKKNLKNIILTQGYTGIISIETFQVHMFQIYAKQHLGLCLMEKIQNVSYKDWQRFFQKKDS